MTIEEFNKRFPIGTPIIYTDDFGGKWQTVVRSPAWDLCGTVVAKLDGKSGGYDIDRLHSINVDHERQAT